MKNTYFSDREAGPRPRVEEEITQNAWGGIVAAIESRIRDDSFGYGYPRECEGGGATVGCDVRTFFLALKADIPDIPADMPWPLDPNQVPPKLAVLDLLEFCHRAVGKPVVIEYDPYYDDHSHLEFKPEEGRAAFRDDINRVLARNGLAYELNPDGLVVRLAPEVLRKTLVPTVFRTGDDELDSLLEAARSKYLDPDPNVRRESLEKLWDAWEPLKTIGPEKDKKAGTKALLDRAAAERTFRETLENEASELTRIGNTFGIRHRETTQVALQLSEHVDYLFHRLFALIRLLLRTTGRLG